MSKCALCGKKIEPEIPVIRKSVCPFCGGDLRICLNCRFYSLSSHNKCLEPKAEFQRTREKSNFCDYFVFSGPSAATQSNSDRDAAKKAFDDLFRK